MNAKSHGKIIQRNRTGFGLRQPNDWTNSASNQAGYKRKEDTHSQQWRISSSISGAKQLRSHSSRGKKYLCEDQNHQLKMVDYNAQLSLDWVFVPVIPDGTYYIRNAANNSCLRSTGGRLSTRTTYTPTAEYQWNISCEKATGFYTLQSKAYPLYSIAVTDAAEGGAVGLLEPRLSGNNHRWQVEGYPDNQTFSFSSMAAGGFLTTAGSDGVVHETASAAEAADKWILEPVMENGEEYAFCNVGSNKYLHAQYTGADAGKVNQRTYYIDLANKRSGALWWSFTPDSGRRVYYTMRDSYHPENAMHLKTVTSSTERYCGIGSSYTGEDRFWIRLNTNGTYSILCYSDTTVMAQNSSLSDGALMKIAATTYTPYTQWWRIRPQTVKLEIEYDTAERQRYAGAYTAAGGQTVVKNRIDALYAPVVTMMSAYFRIELAIDPAPTENNSMWQGCQAGMNDFCGCEDDELCRQSHHTNVDRIRYEKLAKPNRADNLYVFFTGHKLCEPDGNGGHKNTSIGGSAQIDSGNILILDNNVNIAQQKFASILFHEFGHLFWAEDHYYGDTKDNRDYCRWGKQLFATDGLYGISKPLENMYVCEDCVKIIMENHGLYLHSDR